MLSGIEIFNFFVSDHLKRGFSPAVGIGLARLGAKYLI